MWSVPMVAEPMNPTWLPSSSDASHCVRVLTIRASALATLWRSMLSGGKVVTSTPSIAASQLGRNGILSSIVIFIADQIMHHIQRPV